MKGVVLILLTIVSLIVIWLCILAFQPNFDPEETVYVYIDNTTDFDKLCRQLSDTACCRHIDRFRLLSCLLHYPESMHVGRYAVHPSMGNFILLRSLRHGQQAPMRLTFSTVRNTDKLADRIGSVLMLQADSLKVLLADSAYCRSLGFTPETVKALFIPNTYEVFWNITPEAFLVRMQHEYKSFWNSYRRAAADSLRLTPLEVATLASIVEEESNCLEEYSIIAGLYLNRLRRKMPLQADPTVRYAVGDFSLRRIRHSHLHTPSPYNTYLHTGLPPAPLHIPSPQAIDSVLHATDHSYLFMVACPDFSGRHTFTVTHTEHSRAAALYRAALNRRHIR
ncbi:MAG: endolytic transglycosylase MltG [Tannerellaceae bacterium]|nr:endolytic transglycosylase MltG [Tannerellaceae bacterium]